MQPLKDASHLYEVERRMRHAERPGFRINELQISPTQQVPWHYHTYIRDTFYDLAVQLRASDRPKGGSLTASCNGGFGSKCRTRAAPLEAPSLSHVDRESFEKP